MKSALAGGKVLTNGGEFGMISKEPGSNIIICCARVTDHCQSSITGLVKVL